VKDLSKTRFSEGKVWGWGKNGVDLSWDTKRNLIETAGVGRGTPLTSPILFKKRGGRIVEGGRGRVKIQVKRSSLALVLITREVVWGGRGGGWKDGGGDEVEKGS